MLIRVIDFETTGLPPDAAIVEAGWFDIWNASRILADHFKSELVNPGRPIPPEASAVHHIVDADVSEAGSIEPVFRTLMDGADVFAAHNAKFEREFFGGGGRPWICTMKAARRVWPDAPSHSNQALRYWLNLPVDRYLAVPPHRAGPDAYVTAMLLARLIDVASIEDMIKWTEEPSLLPRVNFGKHRGKPWSEIPRDYLEWIAFKSEMDADVKYTAKHHLQQRAT